MPFIETGLNNLLVFEPMIFEDLRGFFYESFNEKTFKNAGIDRPFVQDNQSFSRAGVLRGMHLQKGEYAQAKLVRVLHGEVLDVAVDLRPNSATFGKHFSIVLSSKNKKQLYVPRGFAHGFIVLSETAEFFYKCDNFYNKDAEVGIRFDDKELNIDWIISKEKMIISDKDKALGSFQDALVDL